MLDLLNRALRKRSDQLLADVALIMRGAPTTPAPVTNAWEIEQEVSAAPVEPADQFEGFGTVQYTAHPVAKGAIVPLSHQQLREIVRKASVELRGWDFPHVDNRGNELKNRREPESGLDYIEETTVWNQIAEAWRLFATAFFMLTRVLMEDLQSRAGRRFPEEIAPKSVFNWLQAIGETGEFVLFVGRLYELLGYDGEVLLRIEYNGLAGRRLFTYDPGRDISFRVMPRITAEDRFVYRRVIQLAELRADPISVAVPILKQLFSLFEWDADEEKVLRRDLAALYKRQL